jgi:transcriptional regulator with XRE-family HTH domain
MYSIRHLIDHIGPETVAYRLGVSASTVAAWRYGKRRPGSRTQRKALCRLAGGVDYGSVNWELTKTPVGEQP